MSLYFYNMDRVFKIYCQYRQLGVPEEFIPFLLRMEHIKLEKWDTEKNFSAIEQWIGNDPLKQRFLDYHMENTEFQWNIKPKEADTTGLNVLKGQKMKEGDTLAICHEDGSLVFEY